MATTAAGPNPEPEVRPPGKRYGIERIYMGCCAMAQIHVYSTWREAELEATVKEHDQRCWRDCGPTTLLIVQRDDEERLGNWLKSHGGWKNIAVIPRRQSYDRRVKLNLWLRITDPSSNW